MKFTIIKDGKRSEVLCFTGYDRKGAYAFCEGYAYASDWEIDVFNFNKDRDLLFIKID